MVSPRPPSDVAHVRGEFRPMLGGRMLRHTCEGTIQGQPRHGEEILVWNGAKQAFQSSWVDDFDMSEGIMFSEGVVTAAGLAVTGQYDLGPGQPLWSWRTEFCLSADGELTIAAWNISPEGQKEQAIESVYRRAAGTTNPL